MPIPLQTQLRTKHNFLAALGAHDMLSKNLNMITTSETEHLLSKTKKK